MKLEIRSPFFYNPSHTATSWSHYWETSEGISSLQAVPSKLN